jgi:hypothetical protein
MQVASQSDHLAGYFRSTFEKFIHGFIMAEKKPLAMVGGVNRQLFW